MAEICKLHDDEIAVRASELVVAALREAIVTRGSARLAIAGGSATSPLPPIRKTLGKDWKRVRLTWVDERCVDYDDSDSNRGSVYRQGGLDRDDLPGLELPLWLDGETPAASAARVESVLRSEFDGALDVALLGMGPDGHIASLFPGHDVLADSAGALIAHVADSPKPPPRRMTLTLPFLEKTSHNILVATGESKRDALERLASGDPALPTSSLSNLIVLTNIDLSGHERSK